MCVRTFSNCTNKTSTVILKGYVFIRCLYLSKICSQRSFQDNVLIDSGNKARLADFGLASFDRSRWLVVTSNSGEREELLLTWLRSSFTMDPRGSKGTFDEESSGCLRLEDTDL